MKFRGDDSDKQTKIDNKKMLLHTSPFYMNFKKIKKSKPTEGFPKKCHFIGVQGAHPQFPILGMIMFKYTKYIIPGRQIHTTRGIGCQAFVFLDTDSVCPNREELTMN